MKDKSRNRWRIYEIQYLGKDCDGVIDTLVIPSELDGYRWLRWKKLHGQGRIEWDDRDRLAVAEYVKGSKVKRWLFTGAPGKPRYIIGSWNRSHFLNVPRLSNGHLFFYRGKEYYILVDQTIMWAWITAPISRDGIRYGEEVCDAFGAKRWSESMGQNYNEIMDVFYKDKSIRDYIKKNVNLNRRKQKSILDKAIAVQKSIKPAPHFDPFIHPLVPGEQFLKLKAISVDKSQPIIKGAILYATAMKITKDRRRGHAISFRTGGVSFILFTKDSKKIHRKYFVMYDQKNVAVLRVENIFVS